MWAEAGLDWEWAAAESWTCLSVCDRERKGERWRWLGLPFVFCFCTFRFVFFYLFFFYSLFLSFDFSHCPPLFCYFMAFFGVVRVGKIAFHSEKWNVACSHTACPCACVCFECMCMKYNNSSGWCVTLEQAAAAPIWGNCNRKMAANERHLAPTLNVLHYK